MIILPPRKVETTRTGKIKLRCKVPSCDFVFEPTMKISTYADMVFAYSTWTPVKCQFHFLDGEECDVKGQGC